MFQRAHAVLTALVRLAIANDRATEAEATVGEDSTKDLGQVTRIYDQRCAAIDNGRGGLRRRLVGSRNSHAADSKRISDDRGLTVTQTYHRFLRAAHLQRQRARAAAAREPTLLARGGLVPPDGKVSSTWRRPGRTVSRSEW